MTYTLHHGDCLELIKTLPDNSVDAVVTDPPYCSGGVSEASRVAASGQGLRSETISRFGWFVGDNMGTAGLSWLLRSISVAAMHSLKPSGSALFFMDWRMLPHLVPAIESSGLRYQGLVVWDKGSIGLGRGFRPQHELIAHFTNGKPEYHDKSIPNVITERRVSATGRVHQTEKPVNLLRQLIRVVAPVDGVVLDPFMGSGTTGVAAMLEGRRFIGAEIGESYYETAVKRIGEAAGVEFPESHEQKRSAVDFGLFAGGGKSAV